MLVPKKITIEAFGRFVERQVVDLTRLDNLVQLDAIHKGTGGSSGSGKTTIAHAWEYNLGLNHLPISILQSRLTKNGLYTLGEYELNGIPVIIERGKSKFSVTHNGETTSGSSKLTEEKLDQIIGMPRDLFRKILHKRQGEGGFFLDMGPSDVHKFLTNCLGLEKEQNKILILDDKLNTLHVDHGLKENGLESNKKALEATEEAITILGPSPKPLFDPEALGTLKNRHLSAVENRKSVETSAKAEMDHFQKSRPQITTTPFDRTDIVRIESEISAIVNKITDLELIELNRQSETKSKISVVRVEIEKLNSEESIRQSTAINKVSSLQLEISNLQKIEQNRQAEVKTKISANRLENAKTLNIISQGEKAKEDASRLSEELKKIRASACPTCDQVWVNDAAKAKEAAILNKLQDHRKTVISGMEASSRLLALQEEQKQLDSEANPRNIPEIQDLNNKIEQLKLESRPRIVPEIEELGSQINRLKMDSSPRAIQEAIELKLIIDFKNKELSSLRDAERDYQLNENIKTQSILVAFVQKENELREQHKLALKNTQEEENKAYEAVWVAEKQIKSFEESKKRFEESLTKLQEQLNKYNEQILINTTELALIKEEVELVTEAKKAIKSYLSCSFEDALDSIGDRATRLIRSIPNMATATIQFEGLKETKEGKIKEEVTCSINMDGEIGIPVKSLSGGERSSTDLAIDFSVMEFIQEKSGSGIKLLILDEPFTGLDDSNISCIIELLKETNRDKQILIVDHNPIAKEAFESKITVVRDGLTSKIVQQ